MSGQRRLGLVAAAAGVALLGFVVARRAGVAPSTPARQETMPSAVPSSSTPAVAGAGRVPVPLEAPSSSTPGAPSPALTAVGAARALEAIGKNEQMRRVYMRLQPLGLSREQQDRVLLILGTEALRAAPESPTLAALRASGGARVLSQEEAERVRAERQQIAERTLRALRPALAAVLTPAQLAEVGLSGDETRPTGLPSNGNLP